MKRLDAPRALAIGCGLVLAANAAILGQAAWSRSGVPTATLVLTERELAMPLSREKDDTGLDLTLLPADRPPAAVKLAAWLHRIDLPRFDLPWLDAAKLRELGFDPAAIGDRGALPRYAYVVLENDGEAWTTWLAGQEARTAEAEALFAIDRTSRSRLVPVDTGRDASALRERYPDASRFAVVPASIGVEIDEAHPGKQVPSIALRADTVHVSLGLRPRLEPFIPGIDRNESIRRAREHEDPGLPSPEAPRYRATVSFGRDGRPWLIDAGPIDGGGASIPSRTSAG